LENCKSSTFAWIFNAQDDDFMAKKELEMVVGHSLGKNDGLTTFLLIPLLSLGYKKE